MGIMVKGECECGWTSDMVAVGAGMVEPESEYVAAVCGTCARMVSVVRGGGGTCGRCRGALEVVPLNFDPDLSYVRAEPPVTCPGCGARRVRFVMAGVWD